MKNIHEPEFCTFVNFRQPPVRNAIAVIKGSPDFSLIRGTVYFSRTPGGTQVIVRITGLPSFRPASGGRPQIGPHGFHIHAGRSCNNPDGHWNPGNEPHGNHAGDFPVLFSNHGNAQMSFITDRFIPGSIIGRTVVIHLSPDDYRTQPSGASGPVIACGEIRAAR